MSSNLQKLTCEQVQELRREAGRWLKNLRQKKGLSQRRMAALVGAEYYTFISQIEAGRGRIAPERYLSWAEALEIEPKLLVRTLLGYYDPAAYRVLFGEEVSGAAAAPGEILPHPCGG
jgi:transcriptional regulator with XRE-family HTH domain